jgi:Gamma-glutamyltransferase
VTFDKTVWYLQLVPHGSVATDSAVCSLVGTDIMKNGGNAVDAAVAAVFCLGVVNPHVTGLGGWVQTGICIPFSFFLLIHCLPLCACCITSVLQVCNLLFLWRSTLSLYQYIKYYLILLSQRYYKTKMDMWLFYLIIGVHFRNSLFLQCLKEIGEGSVLHLPFQM